MAGENDLASLPEVSVAMFDLTAADGLIAKLWLA